MDPCSVHSQKTNRLLQLVLVIVFLFLYKMGSLAVSHHKYTRLAFLPRMKTAYTAPLRGDVVDRDGVVLCTNQCEYRVFICFDSIRDIPRVQYVAGGWKRKRIFPRREYIEKFSLFLSKELGLEAQEIRDLIYAQCAIFPHTAFIIKKGISEALFYKLSGAMRLWPGLRVERCSYRVYPKGKVGSHVLGFLGAFSAEKARRLEGERRMLKDYLEAVAEGVIVALPSGHMSVYSVEKRCAYINEELSTMHRDIGKMGVEAQYDDILKGSFGKCFSVVNVNGRRQGEEQSLREKKQGATLKLALSSRLQQRAEELLIEAEERDVLANSGLTPPWVKGGAIVALCPKTREVLALASTPRFDPNHFIQQEKDLMEAELEQPSIMAKLWEGRAALHKERMVKGRAEEIKQYYTPQLFCAQILSKGKVRQVLSRVENVHQAQHIVQAFSSLMEELECVDAALVMEALFCEEQASLPLMLIMDAKQEQIAEKRALLTKTLKPIRSAEDRLLCLDVLRLFVPHGEALFPHCVSLEGYFALTQHKHRLQEKIVNTIRPLFIKGAFSVWRKEHFSALLKEKRREEVVQKTYQRPFTLYLERQKTVLFQQFLDKALHPLLEAMLTGSIDEQYRSYFVACQKQLAGNADVAALKRLAKHASCLHVMKQFKDLSSEPLWGAYRIKGEHTLEKLVRHSYPYFGHGYMKSSAFQEIAPMGSLYKVITAYSAVKERENKGLSLNPLTMYDFSPRHSTQKNHEPLGKTTQGAVIRRVYKGGRLPKSYKSIGKVDLPTALEQSSNLYFSLLASEHISDPLFLLKDSRTFGLGERTGLDLPGEVRGSIPYDVLDDKTALYSMAIGQHALTVTPLQAAQAFATLASGVVQPPSLVKQKIPPQKIFLTEQMKQLIFSGLHRVLNSEKGSAHPSSIQYFKQHKGLYSTLLPHFKHTVGKTSTAELYYRPHLDKETPPLKCNHVWFGAVYHNPNKPLLSDPELVVIVYLKYSDYGKEAAPLAMQLIDCYNKHNMTN